MIGWPLTYSLYYIYVDKCVIFLYFYVWYLIMSFSFPSKHTDLFSCRMTDAEQVGVFTGETKAHKPLKIYNNNKNKHYQSYTMSQV